MLKRLIIVFLVFTFSVSFAMGFWFLSCEKFLDNTVVNIDLKIQKSEPFMSVYKRIFGYLDTPFLFKYFLTKAEHFDRKVHYGHYIFDNQSLRNVLNSIAKGDTYKTKIVIPEGHNIYDIAKKLDQSGICDYETFLSMAFDGGFVKKITGIDAPSFEGFLYPETYNFTEKSEPGIIIQTFYDEFIKNLPDKFEEKLKTYGLSLYEGIIMASVVQKESYDAKEMKTIASVFYNRLGKNMRLEADPTVIYGIYDSFNGNLKKVDLADANNPYNTYKITGLPPTPISNPHKSALIAVMEPSNTNYLYFVADGNGKHIFSETYSAHSRNVYNFQLKKKSIR